VSEPRDGEHTPRDSTVHASRRRRHGTTLARAGLLLLAITLIIAVFFSHVFVFYPFIVAAAVGLITFGLWLNASASAPAREDGE
jgi:hypothetical protein